METITYQVMPLQKFTGWLKKYPEIKRQFLHELDLAFRDEIGRQVVLEDLYDDLGMIPIEDAFILICFDSKTKILIAFLRVLMIPHSLNNTALASYRLRDNPKHYRYALITSVFVATAQRCRGYAKIMFKELSKYLLDKIELSEQKRWWLTLQVLKSNMTALSCYLKSGFEFFDFTRHDYLMVKKLK